jgi:hypothetical protein
MLPGPDVHVLIVLLLLLLSDAGLRAAEVRLARWQSIAVDLSLAVLLLVFVALTAQRVGDHQQLEPHPARLGTAGCGSASRLA